MKDNISIEDYEIGKQFNFDLLSFYESLPEKLEEDDILDFVTEEYHHSLFYPILKYCIDVLNNSKDLDKLKLNIGLYDNDNKIYVTVGRQMYDLFFTGNQGPINDHNIKFNYGKNNFGIKSIYKKQSKEVIEDCKEYFDIPLETPNNKIKEIIESKAKGLDMSVLQLIENKKKNIISRFLKGYSHQEGVIKAFEGKIHGKPTCLPNLIFKRTNNNGKTVEEIDQVYYMKLDKEEDEIEGFDVFYYADYYQKQKKEEIIHEGRKLKLENDSLYFIEIKKSMSGIKLNYEKLVKSKKEIIENKNSEFSKYERQNLTGIGNTILTVNIFSKLINKIINKKKINILYIVDDDFNIDMVQIFQKCLYRDEKVIEDDFGFKIYLIYTQPDLFLENFINENYEKNNKIKFLEKRLDEKDEELKKTIDNKNREFEERIQKYENKIKFLIEQFQFESKLLKIDEEIIEFCYKINNNKSLITIGILEAINKNQKYKFTSLESVKDLLNLNLKDNFFLIDLKTFNRVELRESENINVSDNFVSLYKDKISLCEYFDEVYILVDFVFMHNLSYIFAKIIGDYIIDIFMFENYAFMIYLKKDKKIIIPEIQIIKNSCKNPMLIEEKQKVDIKEVEEFADNYYNFLLMKDFFIDKQRNNNHDSVYLFDFKGVINYILELYVKSDRIEDDKINFYVEIFSVKNEYNICYDILIDDTVNAISYKNIIFVRKTEFGKKYEENKIKEIIQYLFNINNLVIKNKMQKEYKDCFILNSNTLYEDNTLIKIMHNNHTLPILRKSNLEIDPNNLALIEYSYFLQLPLLISKKDYKPNILILANDFGILNDYYTKLYPDKFNIFSFIENKKFQINNSKLLINYNKIEISKFNDAYNGFKKKIKSNNDKFDLILLEYFSKIDNNDVSIPNDNLLLIMKNLLNDEGIFAFNLRAESFKAYNNILELLKKKYKKVIEIKFRICSGLILLCQNEIINLEEYYKPSSISLLDYKYFKEDFLNSLSKGEEE